MRFPNEPLSELPGTREIQRDHLDGIDSVKREMTGSVDDAHPHAR